MRVVVLGAGRVGAVVAADLANDFDVLVCDASEANLARAQVLSTKPLLADVLDFSDAAALSAVLDEADIVVGVAPSRFGFGMLQAAIKAGKPYVDVSFMAEDGWEFAASAKKHGVCAVIDCGVAPGLSHLLAGCGYAQLDSCERIGIYVGGVPVERTLPLEYKAPFSPSDVLEEYVRPARVVEGGQVVTHEALSGVEQLHIPGVGTMEAFFTDGLRSMVDRLEVPDMFEKTMRYPGHATFMRTLRSIGLLDTKPLTVGQVQVSPRDVLAELLFPLWEYGPDEDDMTVLRVDVEGVRAGARLRLRWDLVERTDPETGVSSMARTTAFPCTAMVRLIAAGEVCEPGVWTMEQLGKRQAVVDGVIDQLLLRGIGLSFSEERI